ncbi:6579_t:CDS:2, partial [Acaulospora colombiana]
MWTLICPYFGVNDSGAQQSKLLKTSEDYTIGRNGCNINISEKWMSRQLGRFIVGQHNEADVTWRPPYSEQQDALEPNQDIQVIKPKDCAVLEQITGEPNQLPILLRGGSIVRKEWAQELFRRLYLPPDLPSTDVVSLEDNCLQPALEDYLPSFSPNLKQEYCQNSIWRENTDRKGMLKNLKFIFLVEGAALATVWKNIVDAGEGTYETFDIHKGVVKWITYITQLRGKATEESFGIVLVANEEKSHAAVGGQGWKAFIQDTLRAGLQFTSYTKITEAVLLVQKDLLKSDAHSTNEIIPSLLPNEEPSMEASQGRRGTTRRTKKQPTPVPEPVNPQEDEALLPEDEPVPGRNRNDSQFTTSAAPTSALSDRALSPPVQQPATIDRTKLRRRNPTQRSQAVESETQSTLTLERHRKHFEETDPERHFLSQEQDGVRTRASSVTRSLVDMVEQADLERTKALETGISSRKRKAGATQGEGQDITSENGSLGEPKEPPAKKRMIDRTEKPALEALPEAEEEEEPPPEIPKVKPKKKKEVAVVDSDEKYLTALATWKKGRKKEDQFDREFNNLKIAKPDRLVELDVEMEAWQMMPKDMDVRGNFM